MKTIILLCDIYVRNKLKKTQVKFSTRVKEYNHYNNKATRSPESLLPTGSETNTTKFCFEKIQQCVFELVRKLNIMDGQTDRRRFNISRPGPLVWREIITSGSPLHLGVWTKTRHKRTGRRNTLTMTISW